MRYYYPGVPGLGNVALSRRAQDQATEESITGADVSDVLARGRDRPDGQSALWREHRGIRLVIVVPTPFRGARLVTAMYRVQAQAKLR